jgi:hypothetical protein
MIIKLNCHSCGKELEYVDRVGLREECPHCHADVHSCRNCHFYDPKVYNECRETSAEVVREKDRANYCDYFQPRAAGGADPNKAKQDLMSAAEALFKKKS